MFVQVRPAPPLQSSIETIWDWTVAPGPFRLERILPTPGAGLIVNLLEDETRVYSDDELRRCETTRGFTLSGQPTHSFLIDTREQIAVMGVVFRPAGAARFFRERMDHFSDRHVALTDFAGQGIGSLRERLLATADASTRIGLLEAWLCARYAHDAVHPVVEFALRALAASPQLPRIDALVAASGLSARRFGTLFRQQVGVAPKVFARTQRFRSVIDGVQRGRHVEWANVAADCGFHDQSHLTREFRAFSGMTPGAYVALRGGNVNHIALD